MDFLATAVALISALFSGFFSEITYVAPSLIEPPRATIVFGGDMMFDRTVRTTMDERGGDFLFSCIDDVLRGADLVVANLEGPITSNPSVSIGTPVGGEGNYTFTFPTSTAQLLARHNIRLVNLGNNHIMNFGREGLVETKKWLDSAGVAYFGLPAEASACASTHACPRDACLCDARRQARRRADRSAQASDPDLAERERVERMEVRGVPVSFVNWSDWAPLDSSASGAGEQNPVVEQIRAEKGTGRLVIVYTHWGVEYATTSSAYSHELAHSFIDAGADIVVGSHPHVMQERELYQGRYVYYSLGNFMFDQYWSDEVRRGLLLRVTLSPAGVSRVEEIPIYNQSDRRPCTE
jgi:poly-gamma-glutamate synthesis protein (capsule biosynthesis protein)